MPESSDKLIPISRREPLPRRQRQRQTPKAKPKKATSQPQGSTTAETMVLKRLNPHTSPASIPSGGLKRLRTEVAIPPSGRQIKTSKNPPSPLGGTKIKTVRIQKQGSPTLDRRGSRKTRLKPMARTLLYTLRLLIVGVGIGAIVGTLLSVLDPANRLTNASLMKTTGQSQAQSNSSVNTSSLFLSQEITTLKTAVQNLITANPKLTTGVFMIDLDNGAYVDINGTTSFPAASTIKLPILVAFFQDVDAGKIRLDEMLTMQKEMLAGGSGNLQYQTVGSQYSALEIATKMITISDNTATNMLITRLGGMEVLNERFRTWGLANTAIRNPLPDLTGTNTTSPGELVNLLSMVNQGNFVSMRSRDLMLDIMRRTERDNLLPSGLGTGAKAYHKTGDIATMLADAGLIDVPTGKRYIAAVMVQRPNNDPSAQKLISSISRTAYEHFSQVALTPTNNIPSTTYQQPIQPFIQPQVMTPILPNGAVNSMPTGTYQPPLMNPQYYPPR
ncbi:serine hydrolase [Cronbergia sp. UHCC 0137]|uniref:serine hydrolase n=1 Tax=Cronbergia sp. UHCC 0137 TaxID=3110239 RepID=UPI002B219D86|nr:serine hydrolase [Cronbergia sp. UHCC 0137]MEA5620302.1 serine hydrolase [Cronbergia sp. UHCC 0137]